MTFKTNLTLLISLVLFMSCAQDLGEKVVSAYEQAWVQFNSLAPRAEKGDMESISQLRNLSAQLNDLEKKKLELEKTGGFTATQKARLQKLADEIK